MSAIIHPRTALLASLLAATAAAAPQDRVAISFENLAPSMGTFATPVWVGLHDGTFDIWTGGQPAAGPGSPLGTDGLERLAEDGTTGPIASTFLTSFPSGVETTVFGPNGPIAPGDRAFTSLLVDPNAPTSRYLSFASMVIPSNDAFVANGSPVAHPLYDSAGNFVFDDFIETEVLDAGTEVNDELPVNTAFFGQMAPNTGVEENGVVSVHGGFNPRGSGGILDSFRFRNGDFSLQGYSLLMLRVRRAPAITDDRTYATFTNNGGVAARVGAFLSDGGTSLRVAFAGRNLLNVVGVELRDRATGSSVATIVGPLPAGGGDFGTAVASVELTGGDLTGALADYPLDALVGAIESGDVEFVIRTDDGDPATSGQPGDMPDGELVSTLQRI